LIPPARVLARQKQIEGGRMSPKKPLMRPEKKAAISTPQMVDMYREGATIRDIAAIAGLSDTATGVRVRKFLGTDEYNRIGGRSVQRAAGAQSALSMPWVPAKWINQNATFRGGFYASAM